MDSQLEKMTAGEVYYQTAELLEVRLKTRDILYQYNRCHPRDMDHRAALIQKMFGSIAENFFIEIPFHCDQGFNIHIGKNFFANNNCTFLDVCPITIGEDVLFAPNVGIYTAGHAIDPMLRVETKAEYGAPIVIGNNVWVGANTTILPGVTIGDNVVIAAGSVVVKDIPKDHVALGNPCKVVRKVNERDREFYFREKRFPQEYLERLKK